MSIPSHLRSTRDSLRRKWDRGDWKVRALMGGTVVGGVFVFGLLMMLLLGGGGGGGPAEVEGVTVGEGGVMTFDDEVAEEPPEPSGSEPAGRESASGDSGGTAPAGGQGAAVGGNVDSVVADAVAATLEALLPTVEPTKPADYMATLEAGLHSSRSEYPSLSINPLDPSNERQGGGLNEAEIELFGQYGVYFWDMLQAWVVTRSVLYSREVHEWERDWLEDQLDLVEWMMPEPRRWVNDRSGSTAISEVVNAFLAEVRDGEYAMRDAVTSLNAALGVFERAGVDDFRDLGPEEADEVWQHYFDAESSGLELSSVMSSYGCSICGELYRASGAPVRGGR